MVHKLIFISTLLFVSVATSGQTIITQTIRGTVLDKESKSPLPFATVMLLDSDPIVGTLTDTLGSFTLSKIPIGRQTIKVSFQGYKSGVVSDIQLSSAKEIVLQIELEENVTELATVTIRAGNTKDKTVNDMIGISGRTFSTNEANRFAGSQNDPARMARNYAGVSGASDQRNDIIVRGNSPQGLLWRIEGIPVPNPNHFAGQGSTGGPISIINYKLLSNSDFITGAFPAEYGNAVSGIFDIRMRDGNNKKMERTIQIGALGLEAIIEGPFSKTNNSSYLVAYRYSTLSILANAGVKLGFASVPYYQDLSFKLNFVTKKTGTFKLFGLGGISSTEFLDSKSDSNQFSPANKGENVRFGSKTGIVGVSHTYFLSNNAFIKTTIATTYEGNGSQRDTIQTNNKLKRIGGFGYDQQKYVLSSFFNKKINSKHTIQTGIVLENVIFKTKDSLLLYKPITGIPFWGYNNDFSGNTMLFQAYSQWKHKINEMLTLNSGVHLQYLTLNNTFAIEPRVAINYRVTENQTLSIGYGLHNQVQPYGMYFYKDKYNTTAVETNKSLGFTKSNQLIAGYDLTFNNGFRLKTETYYQHLSSVPVEVQSSSYSVMNYGATFYNQYRDSLVNKGTGYNYGAEITLEKFFTHNYYFLMTASLFNSKYKGSDGIERNTAFNGNYVVNALGGYELKWKNNVSFLIDAKFTVAGGLRFTPIDLLASAKNNEATYKENEANSLQNAVYFKPDLKLTVRKSYNNQVALEWALDVQNVVNYQNVFLNWYDKNTNTEHPVYQNGRFPTVQLKLEF
ncbi:MAG: TonB-dependent receptor [Cytophagales bacterium]|nr:MAG: TonB-dependent receptor [Cytophagales bacterium]